MIRETVYDEIFDSQRHFRTLLDAMARPGKLNRFAPVPLTPPSPLLAGAAYVALALLNADATYHAVPLGEDVSTYLRVNTAARATPVAQSDFVFLDGHNAASSALIAESRMGIPAYPETGATIVIQVAHVGRSSNTGGLNLTLTGPGIETVEHVFVNGLHPALLEARHRQNREFPLGVDTILVTTDGTVLCLPRTTHVSWETV